MPDDNSPLEPRLPISNRTVKRRRADDSADYLCESRSSSGTLKTNAQPLRLGVGSFAAAMDCLIARWAARARKTPPRMAGLVGARTWKILSLRDLATPDDACGGSSTLPPAIRGRATPTRSGAKGARGTGARWLACQVVRHAQRSDGSRVETCRP